MSFQDIQTNMVADPMDLRDRIYSPSLRALPPECLGKPTAIKNQELTQACTGFALAAMVEHLEGSQEKLSPFMGYFFARRYDGLTGEDPEGGSTARGAMKAWFHHGLCTEAHWPDLDLEPSTAGRPWVSDALKRPMGAYYRVDHTSIPDMHAAITETGVVYATVVIHAGWEKPDDQGQIPMASQPEPLGGHAVLVIGYDKKGFWVQNSWGKRWGRKGIARITYQDWRLHVMDAWVAQIGVHVSGLVETLGHGLGETPSGQANALSSDPRVKAQQINPYIVNIENDGFLSNEGKYSTRVRDLHDLVNFYLNHALQSWGKGPEDPIDVAIYAHGGLVDEAAAAETAERWIPRLFENQIFPVFLMWETGFKKTFSNIVREALGLGLAGVGFWERVQDWKDDRLESLLSGPGKKFWDEMKENAERATVNPKGGLRLLKAELDMIPNSIRDRIRLHLIGHSAGGVLHCHLMPALLDAGMVVDSVSLMAPACTTALFEDTMWERFQRGQCRAYTQYSLPDVVEENEKSIGVYNRSLLYLVSNAFEGKRGTGILGMEKFLSSDLLRGPAGMERWEVILSSIMSAESRSLTHGDFDNDETTIASVVKRLRERAALVHA